MRLRVTCWISPFLRGPTREPSVDNLQAHQGSSTRVMAHWQQSSYSTFSGFEMSCSASHSACHSRSVPSSMLLQLLTAVG